MSNAEPSYLIDRTQPPRWVTTTRGGIHAEGATSSFGEQAEWGWAIPNLYRLLAAPQAGASFPVAPSDDSHDVSLAYWAALLQLLIYSFGWSRPDRGLHWWYEAGHPTEDARLALIDQLWRADGQLDWFASWMWTTPTIYDSGTLCELSGHDLDNLALAIDTRWVDARTREAERAGVSSPAPAGGWDPLHLSAHCNGPLQEPGGAVVLLHSNPKERHAVLLVDSMIGWYRALCERGGALPSLGDRSWRVDVVAKPVGHLGTFRRSRETGLWFAGKHRFHTLGV